MVKFKVVEHLGKWYIARETRGSSSNLIGPYKDRDSAKKALPIIRRSYGG